MDINNTQFSILMSSVTLINTVLALVAGVFADDFSSTAIGTLRGTLAVNLFNFIGSLITVIGARQYNFNMMLAGQMIFGLGDCVIVTFQESILSRWFRNKQLTIIVGLMLSMARLTKFIAKLVCYPLVDYANDFTRPIVVALVLCAISIVVNGVYWVTMVKSGLASPSGKELYANRRSNKKFSLFLYLPAIFWMVPWLQLTLSSVLSSFDDISTEFVQFRFSTTSLTAGIQSSLVQLIPIIAAPLSGIFIERFGRRLHFLVSGSIILLIALLLLTYTQVTPVVGILMISTTLALGPIGILSSCSLLLPIESIGIGIGLKKSSNNVGSTIISIIIGYIQDLTFHDNDDTDDLVDQQYQYDYVMIFLIIVSVIAVVLAVMFWWMDRHYLNSWLQANRKERDRRVQAVNDKAAKTVYEYVYSEGSYRKQPKEECDSEEDRKKALKLIGSQLKQKRSFLCAGFYLFWVVTSWAIFFVFALMPIYQHYEL